MKVKKLFFLIIISVFIVFGFNKPTYGMLSFQPSSKNVIVRCTLYELKRGMRAYNLSPLSLKRVDFLTPDKHKKLWLSIARGPESQRKVKFKPFA
uniref:Uncharacterized protein n=1 Tax=Parietochloris pseudoalveolaris TaxID=3102 RepID=A0A097KLM4_9CHLO|nr:hypothetical protein [Parietochloris pseudoalveolaris]AIT94065.1 hypothetical protein [Parietochloris pseudoalveolaris]